jgi:hypothetical protein
MQQLQPENAAVAARKCSSRSLKMLPSQPENAASLSYKLQQSQPEIAAVAARNCSSRSLKMQQS